MRKSFREEKKTLINLLLLFNDLEYGRNELFCCNGYSHVIFTILFYESQVEELRIAFIKEKKEHKSNNDSFIAVLLLF